MLTNDTPVITDEGAWTDDFPTRPLGRSGNVVRSLAEQLDSRLGRSRVIGESAPWQGVLKKATQVAATETTVLLQGDSGTGKEVLARFIHRTSPRKNGPFVAINCAALPDQLLESELFGHERGAFTGALQPKPGQIEVASGGVLFLDEVAEMSPSAQAKLLRVLQEREFQRLGATRALRAEGRSPAFRRRLPERHRTLARQPPRRPDRRGEGRALRARLAGKRARAA